MAEPDIGNREYTCFPFGLSASEYRQELRYLTVAQLEDSLEIKRWLVIDPDAVRDDHRYLFAWQIDAIVRELDRRKQLLKTRGADPLAPKWVGGQMVHSRERIDRIKARWPVDRFLRESLGCTLKPIGRNRFITNCPLPNHTDTNPSFKINTEKDLGYCFGCHRGGDVVEIARWYLNITSFSETLTALENEGALHDRRH